MPLDAMRGEPSGLDEFRIDSPREVAGVLRQLCDAGTALQVSGSGDDNGAAIAATLWSTDALRGSIGLAIDSDDAVAATSLAALLEHQDGVVVGYLDDVKIQFDLAGLVLVQGRNSSTLKCGYPTEIYRFQRRNAFRVRPTVRSAPTATVRHSEIAEMRLSLRLLNISIGGCAIFLPEDVPPMRPGQVLNQVQLDLDADTRINVSLRLQHVTLLDAESRGVRLGCEFMRTDSNTLRMLQRFIDQTQKRGRLLSLD